LKGEQRNNTHTHFWRIIIVLFSDSSTHRRSGGKDRRARVRLTSPWSCTCACAMDSSREGAYRETLKPTLRGCRSILRLAGTAVHTGFSPASSVDRCGLPRTACSLSTTHLLRPPFLIVDNTGVPPQETLVYGLVEGYSSSPNPLGAEHLHGLLDGPATHGTHRGSRLGQLLRTSRTRTCDRTARWRGPWARRSTTHTVSPHCVRLRCAAA
jgi:hypothetical protein